MSKKPTIHALTGIRALAAGWVLLFHLQRSLIELFPSFAALRGFFESGYLGVDLFFVLSGFILAYTYEDRFDQIDAAGVRRFLKARLARVYPVHLAVLLLLVFAVPLGRQLGMSFATRGPYEFAQLPLHLTLTHAWGFSEGLYWNIPSWSISAEWFAYLCFPLLVGPLSRVRGFWPAVSAALCSVALMLLALDRLGYVSLDLTFDGALLRVGPEFVAGMLLCRAFRSEQPALPWDLIAALCLAGVVGITASLGPTRPVVFLLALLILALANSQGPLAAGLGSRAMVYAGTISYALYMTQGLVFLAGESLLPAHAYAGAGLPARLGVLAAYFVGLGGLASFVYHFVEEPGREFVRKLGDAAPPAS